MHLDLSRWPLVDRDETVQRLAGWYDDPGCQGMILTGPAGVGKTTTAHAVVQELSRREPRFVVRIVATEALRTVPFGALAHLMPVDALQSTGTVDPTAIFNRIRDVATSAGRGRILTVVDDLPFLDDATQSVAAQLHAAGLAFLVATMRTGARLHPGQLCLERSFGVRRFQLDALDREAVSRMITTALGGTLDARSFEQVWELSNGNPLYVRELLLNADQRGALHQTTGGLWSLTDVSGARSLVGDVIGARLSQLDESALEALTLLSIAGQFPVSDLERAGHLEAVDELERLGLVTISHDTTDPEVQVAHPLHAEAVRSRLGIVGLRRVLRRAIDLVQSRPRHRVDDAARLAGWQLDVGVAPDTETLVQGARLARSSNDFTSAVRLARAALESCGSIEMRRILVEALSMTGDANAAEAEAAVPVDAGEDDEDERMQLVAARLYNLVWNLNDQAMARAVIDTERRRFHGSAMQDLLTLRHATVLSFEDRCLDALAELESRAEWSEAIFPTAMAGLSQLQLIVGRVERALASARAALDALGPARTKAPAQPFIAHANALAASGRLLDAIDAIRAAREQVDAPTLYKAAMAFTYGELLSQHGRIDRARKAYAEAVLFAEAIDNRNLRTMALGSLAAMMGQLGESQAAAGLLAEVDDSLLPFRTASDERARGMAWALTLTGRPADARSIVASTASACQDAGEHWDALRLWIDAARLGAARDILPRAKECAQHVDGPVAAAFIAFITAAATDDPADLAEAAAGLADLGHDLLAAEAWALAATGYRRDGNSRASSAALARSAAHASLCEGAVTVERLVAALNAPVVPLSAREREIALMAADGLGNSDIAERLTVSVRTVANHLQNAYVKLGVNRRSDLRDALSRD